MASCNSSDQTNLGPAECCTNTTVSECVTKGTEGQYCIPTSKKGCDDDGDEASVWSTSPPQPWTIDTSDEEKDLWHFNHSPIIDASEWAWPPFSGAQKTPDPEQLKSEDAMSDKPNPPHSEAKKSPDPIRPAGDEKTPDPEPLKDKDPSYDPTWWRGSQTAKCPCSWCDPNFHTRRHRIHAKKNKGWDFGVAAMLGIPLNRIQDEEKASDPEPLWVQDEDMPYTRVTDTVSALTH